MKRLFLAIALIASCPFAAQAEWEIREDRDPLRGESVSTASFGPKGTIAVTCVRQNKTGHRSPVVVFMSKRYLGFSNYPRVMWKVGDGPVRDVGGWKIGSRGDSVWSRAPSMSDPIIRDILSAKPGGELYISATGRFSSGTNTFSLAGAAEKIRKVFGACERLN